METVNLALTDEQAEALRREYVDRYQEKSAELSGARSKQFQQKYQKVTMNEIVGLLLADELDFHYDI